MSKGGAAAGRLTDTTSALFAGRVPDQRQGRPHVDEGAVAGELLRLPVPPALLLEPLR